jgi:hypothetical protein
MENHDPITVGQIGKIQELLGAALRKSGLQNRQLQRAIEKRGTQIIDGMMGVLYSYAAGLMFTRHAVVNRTRSPQEAIDATGRKKAPSTSVLKENLHDDIVKIMPRGEGNEADVVFFKAGEIGGWDRGLEFYDLDPADPVLLASVNEADPVFADEYPNCTYWMDPDGNRCEIDFYKDREEDGGERRVRIQHGPSYGSGIWWYAGVPRKK